MYADDDGQQPFREWLLKLDRDKRAAVIAAIEVHLEARGLDVCATEHGKQLGDGLFELRIRHDEAVTRGQRGDGARRGDILLRIFCHAHGNKVVVLLGGYDKRKTPAARKQAREIEKARRALRAFRLRQARKASAQRRGH